MRTRIFSLKLGIHREKEGKTSETEYKDVLVLVKCPRTRGSEASVDLVHCWCYFGAVENVSRVFELEEFEVVDFDEFESLGCRGEMEAEAVGGEEEDEIGGEGFLGGGKWMGVLVIVMNDWLLNYLIIVDDMCSFNNTNLRLHNGHGLGKVHPCYLDNQCQCLIIVRKQGC